VPFFLFLGSSFVGFDFSKSNFCGGFVTLLLFLSSGSFSVCLGRGSGAGKGGLVSFFWLALF
jgi:hypothetical protein